MNKLSFSEKTLNIKVIILYISLVFSSLVFAQPPKELALPEYSCLKVPPKIIEVIPPITIHMSQS